MLQNSWTRNKKLKRQSVSREKSRKIQKVEKIDFHFFLLGFAAPKN